MAMMAKIDGFSRRLRPLVMLRQIRHRRELRDTSRIYDDLELDKPWYDMVRHSEVAGRGDPPARLDRPGGERELEADPRFAALPEATRTGLREWPEAGYLVLDGFFGPDRVAAVNAEIEELTSAGSLKSHHRSPRVMNAHRKSQAARSLVDDERLRDVLELILGRRAELFQTISFARGSQQSAHSDAFHMMTEPPGYLVGVWVALEDIAEDSGPVFYLPGSHRLPYVMTEDLDLGKPAPLLTADKGRAYVERMRGVVGSAGIEPRPFTASAGDVLLWHHNLLHGGSAIERPGATRRSLVAHFFAEGVLCYHEVTERLAVVPASSAG